MRNPEKETELNSADNITVLQLDVTNPEQIKSTVSKALESGDIDVVFNNAGYGLVGPLEATTDEQMMRQITTNLLGVIRVTKEFIPAFRKKGSGLFITTTSIGGLVTFPLNSLYHATKWALEGWSESMAFELGEFGIGIKTVSPGGIKTDFISRSLDTSMQPEYKQILDNVFAAFNNPERANSYSTAEQIAAVVYEAATDGKSKLRYVAGEDAKALYAKRNEANDEAFRKEIGDIFLNK